MHSKFKSSLAAASFMALCLTVPATVHAQAAVVAASDQLSMLESDDPVLAQNKRLVFDMWRTLLEAGQVEQADQFIAEDYIQHNPNVASGRAPLVNFLSNFVQPSPIEDTIPGLVSIVAEGDLVVLSFVREYGDPRDPGDPAKAYTTTWFDMFRVEDGMIVEHWDSSLKF